MIINKGATSIVFAEKLARLIGACGILAMDCGGGDGAVGGIQREVCEIFRRAYAANLRGLRNMGRLAVTIMATMAAMASAASTTTTTTASMAIIITIVRMVTSGFYMCIHDCGEHGKEEQQREGKSETGHGAER